MRCTLPYWEPNKKGKNWNLEMVNLGLNDAADTRNLVVSVQNITKKWRQGLWPWRGAVSKSITKKDGRAWYSLDGGRFSPRLLVNPD